MMPTYALINQERLALKCIIWKFENLVFGKFMNIVKMATMRINDQTRFCTISGIWIRAKIKKKSQKLFIFGLLLFNIFPVRTHPSKNGHSPTVELEI